MASTTFKHHRIGSKVYCLDTVEDKKYKGKCCVFCQLSLSDTILHWIVVKRTISHVDYRQYIREKSRLLYGVVKHVNNSYDSSVTLHDKDVFSTLAKAKAEAKKRNNTRPKKNER